MSRVRRIAVFAVAESFGRAATWFTVFALPWILGPDEYGMVVLLATFEGVAAAFLMLGQDRAIMWRCAAEEEFEEARSWVATAIVVTIVACAAGLLAITAITAVGGGRVLGVPVWPHLWLLGVAVVCVNVHRIVLAFVRVIGRTWDFVRYRAATGVGRLAVTLGLAAVTGSSLAFPAGAAAGTLGGGWPLWRRSLRGVRLRPALRRDSVERMVRFGAPLSLHALSMNGVTFIDRWVIGSMLGLAVVGSYGWYYMLGSAVMFLYAALTVYYEPEIYREWRRAGSLTRLREYVGIAVTAGGLYGLVGCGVASVAGHLVPATVEADPSIVRVVLVAHWLYPIYLAGNYLLSACGRTGRLAGMSAGALVIVLAGNLVLVPVLGAIGGAWATLLGAGWLALAVVYLAWRLDVGGLILAGPALGISLVGAAGLVLPGLGGLAAASAALSLLGAVYTLRHTGWRLPFRHA